MIRRESRPKQSAAAGGCDPLLTEMLTFVNPAWADRFRMGEYDKFEIGELDKVLGYLANVEYNARLYIPAARPDYGISERGGDAILGYLKNPDAADGYYFFADVSGFTALLTFLTERFGKEEAGDIMNLGILNRFCLNKMGYILKDIAEGSAGDDLGFNTLKIMMAIRASMPRISKEVRGELRDKLSGKSHQKEIQQFIDELTVKASGGVIYDPESRSSYYGNNIRTRITWGNTGKLVAQAEKLGGNDDRVREDLEEVKGFGVDVHCYDKLMEFLKTGWMGLNKDDVAIGQGLRDYRKIIIADSGMEKLSGYVDQVCRQYLDDEKSPGVDESIFTAMSLEEKKSYVDDLAGKFHEIERYIGGMSLLLHIQRNLGQTGKKNILLDESCSAVRDSGVLFCNFSLEDPSVMDDLVDEVHTVMGRYGIHYKYNIFPKGDFNLMGVLGTMFSEKRDMDKYFPEILWNTWRDLKSVMKGVFDNRVEIRGGMSVGKALQGPAGDNVIHNEETIIGPDCNLAARLVNEALEMTRQGEFVYPGGSLFTVQSHRRKVEHLVHPDKPVKEANLKGFSQPVELYNLVERGEVESMAEFIARLRQVDLVTVRGECITGDDDLAKDEFLAECVEVLDGVTTGKVKKAQLISFIADSGVGKTRRIAEFAHWAIAKKSLPVYFGECYSWYQGEKSEDEDNDKAMPESHSDEGSYPFYPFIRILKEQIFRVNNTDSLETKQAKVEQVLASIGRKDENLIDHAPVLASFIGVELPENDFSSALDAEARRNVFYERVGDIFASEVNRQQSGSGGLLLCIDDLQWSDRNSLHLLSFIANRVGPGLIICVNARQKEQLGILLDESLEVDRHIFEPGLLEQDAIVKLARLVLGITAAEDSDGDLPFAVKERINKELECNPFFVIEFCLKMQEQEMIVVSDGKVTRFNSDGFKDITIPTKIQGVIEDRISRLPRTELAAIQYSSVLGNILRYIIVRQFLPAVDRDAMFEDSNLDEIFAHLTGQEITRLENEKDPDWVYSFKRALIGEKLYQELVPSLRKRLHREVAKIFESTDLANPFEKRLLTALHYSNGEVPDKACEHYLEAARLAKQVFDNDKSLMLLSRIEELLDGYNVSNAESRRMVMLQDRGEVNLLLGKYTEALADFSTLAELAEKHEKKEMLAQSYYSSGKAHLQRSGPGDFDNAIDYFTKAVETTNDDALLAHILSDSARTHLEKGKREEALGMLDRAITAYQESVVDRELDADDYIFLAGLARNRGSVMHRQGKFNEAIEIYNTALTMVADEKENRYKKIRALICNSIGLSLMKQFKLAESKPWFDKALALARSIGDLKTELMVRINMGVVANDSGKYEEALEMLTEELYALQMLVGETRELGALMFNIGESHMFMENFEDAEPWYRRALMIARNISYPEFEVAVSYNLGEVLNELGRPDEATEVLVPAYELAGEHDWYLQRMDMANLLGEISRAGEDYTKARDYHNEALNISRKLEDDFGMGWAMRNIALDILENPDSDDEQKESCAEMLESSLELARSAGQPENLMHSLRALISYRIEFQKDRTAVETLIEELADLAEKHDSEIFKQFCNKLKK